MKLYYPHFHLEKLRQSEIIKLIKALLNSESICQPLCPYFLNSVLAAEGRIQLPYAKLTALNKVLLHDLI